MCETLYSDIKEYAFTSRFVPSNMTHFFFFIWMKFPMSNIWVSSQMIKRGTFKLEIKVSLH